MVGVGGGGGWWGGGGGRIKKQNKNKQTIDNVSSVQQSFFVCLVLHFLFCFKHGLKFSTTGLHVADTRRLSSHSDLHLHRP